MVVEMALLIALALVCFGGIIALIYMIINRTQSLSSIERRTNAQIAGIKHECMNATVAILRVANPHHNAAGVNTRGIVFPRVITVANHNTTNENAWRN